MTLHAVLTTLLALLAGAFLCNGVPHLVAGLQGTPFPTPFATPRGVGDSPPLLNVYWGAGNLLAGAALLVHTAPGELLDWAPVVVGALLFGTRLSTHFGKVRARG